MGWIIGAIAVLIVLAICRLGTTTPPEPPVDQLTQAMQGQQRNHMTPLPAVSRYAPSPVTTVYHVVEVDYCMAHKGVRYHGETSSPWCQWHGTSDDDCDLVSLARMDTR